MTDDTPTDALLRIAQGDTQPRVIHEGTCMDGPDNPRMGLDRYRGLRPRVVHPREYDRMVRDAATQEGWTTEALYAHLGHEQPVWDPERDEPTPLHIVHNGDHFDGGPTPRQGLFKTDWIRPMPPEPSHVRSQLDGIGRMSLRGPGKR